LEDGKGQVPNPLRVKGGLVLRDDNPESKVVNPISHKRERETDCRGEDTRWGLGTEIEASQGL